MTTENFYNPQLKEGEFGPTLPNGNFVSDGLGGNGSDSGTPGFDWQALLQQALQAGATIGAAVIQANAQSGQHFNASQIPQYIINSYGSGPVGGNGSGNPVNPVTNPKSTTGNTSGTILGMSTEVFIIALIAFLSIGGFALYYFTKVDK